jgi:hypothetical protein
MGDVVDSLIVNEILHTLIKQSPIDSEKSTELEAILMLDSLLFLLQN